MLIGQEKLKSRLSYLIENNILPNTIILVGPEGQGKKSMARWIAGALDAPVYVPEDVKIDSIREVITDSRTVSSPKLYLLADAENMTIQSQNALLKLSEEPPENAYIVITTKDTSVLLPTILSRSVVFRLDGYSLEELNVFTTDVDLMKIAQNPGTIKKLKEIEYQGMLKHAQKVVDNISKITAANAFNILRSVEKEHYMLFLSMLIHAYGEKLKQGIQCGNQLDVIYETKRTIESSKSVNKQNALEMMFVRLREVSIHEVQ